MTDILKLFDSYSRQARLYPALLMLLPVLFMAIARFPDLLTTGKVLLTIAVACGVLFWLADLARSRGKRIEPALLKKWGGWPTTIWLRHSDNHIPDPVKQRYHAFLGRQGALGPLPTSNQEATDPHAADQQYASAVMWLKEQSRGPAFPLVERENAVYGFRRNMLGLKPIAILLCLATLALPAVAVLINLPAQWADLAPTILNAYLKLDLTILGALSFSILALVSWTLVVREPWVREAGDQYARALLACCDSLPG